MKSTHSLSALLLALLLTLLACGCKDKEKDSIPPPPADTPDTPYLNVPAAREVVMYEVNPRVFAKQDALKAITARLDEIKALGTNVIWLMPIYEQGVLKAKSADGSGSPYCIRDYRKIDPEYGTLTDLQHLVREAHRRDMAVILDFVANHTAWDNAWITQHPEWYTHNAAGEIIHPAGTDWTDVADLNFGTAAEPNTDLYNAFFDAMKYWFDAANIDGFRCDALDYVPKGFCQQLVVEMRNHTAGRKILLLSEGDKQNYFAMGFDMDYSWTFYTYINLLYNKPASMSVKSFVASVSTLLKNTPADKSHLYFTTNHDKSAWEKTDVQLFGSTQAALSAFVLTATLADAPLIYSTQEIGREAQVPFFKYTAIDWNARPDVLAEYKRIMTAYRSTKAFALGTLTTYNDNADIVYFSRTYNGETVLVAVNIRSEAKTLSLPAEFAGKNAETLISKTTAALGETENLGAYEYRLWKMEESKIYNYMDYIERKIIKKH